MRWQAPAEHRLQVPRQQALHARLQLDIGDQRLGRAVRPGPRHRHSVLDPRAGPERALDLAQLDAEAAQLDLVVAAAEHLVEAVGASPTQIAGAIAAQIGRGTSGEGLRRALRLAPIALGDIGALDHELAGLARPDLRPLGVLQHDPGAGQLAADGQGAASATGGLLDEPSRIERALRGAEMRGEAGLGPADAADQIVVGPVHPIAAEGDQPQALQPLRPRGDGDVAEQGGRGAEDGDPPLADLAHQPLAAEGGGDQQVSRGAGQEGPQHGAQARRHRRRIEQGGPVLRRQAEALHRVEEIGVERSVGLEGPLRGTGRAGGVEDVGEVPGRGRSRRGAAALRLQDLDVQELGAGAEHRPRASRQLRDGEHRRSAGMTGDQPVAAIRMVCVQGDDPAPRRQHAEQGRRRARVVRRQHGDGTFALERPGKGGGDGRDPGRQFAIGEAPGGVLDRRAAGMPPRRVEKPVDDRLHLGPNPLANLHRNGR